MNNETEAVLLELRELVNQRIADCRQAHPTRPHEPGSTTFGRILTVDAWCCSNNPAVAAATRNLLNSPEALAQVLNDAVEHVGMTILRPADMVVVPLDPGKVSTGEDDGGVTGTVILTTSHAAIHTWPLQRQLSFDMFSCQDFAADELLDFLVSRLYITGAQARTYVRDHNVIPKDRIVLFSP